MQNVTEDSDYSAINWKIQKCEFLVTPKYQPLLLHFSVWFTCFCQNKKP